MRQEIDQSDINQMNNLIFKKIKEQFEKDLTPSEFISTARLAIAFQKVIKVQLHFQFYTRKKLEYNWRLYIID